jgi:enoyl-[acyl-carrier protein] reductase III
MRTFVAGGSTGIGRAIAIGLAGPDDDVLIGFRTHRDAAEETCAEVEARGARAHLVQEDLSTADGTRRALKTTAELVPDLDALVHCVVKPVGGRLIDMDPAEVASAIEASGTSLLYLVQAARPLLRAGSSVIYLSSRGSQIALPGYGPAGVPKALGECLVRYLSAELAEAGVRVNTIAAGPLDTPAFRTVLGDPTDYLARVGAKSLHGRPLDFDDVVGVARFLVSADGAMVHGQRLVVDGGFSLRA